MKEKFKEEVMKIKKDHIMNTWWLGEDTFCMYLEMSEELKELYRELINENKVNQDEEDSLCILVEYWLDVNEIKYILNFEYDSVNIENDIQCDHLDDLARKALKIETMREYTEITEKIEVKSNSKNLINLDELDEKGFEEYKAAMIAMADEPLYKIKKDIVGLKDFIIGKDISIDTSFFGDCDDITLYGTVKDITEEYIELDNLTMCGKIAESKDNLYWKDGRVKANDIGYLRVC